MITLSHITKTFGDGAAAVQAVKDVSLEINRGEIFGIIGFSGAGKSTLVRCINLLERPTSGSVVVDNINLTELAEKQLRGARQKIGMIFQHFNLMPSRTAFENIAFPLKGSGMTKEQIESRVRELLALVGMQEKESAYPSQLSGGQKQRVAIARALANKPSVLLCDEATSALDPQTTHSILKLLQRLNQTLGITIVIITHEMAVIKEICSRVAVMENGCVAETGDVFSIFSSPKAAITREFVRTTSNLSKIYELIAEHSPVVALKPNELVLRLTYKKKNVSEPLISDITHRFGIVLNIIFGDVELIDGAPLGGVVVIADGDRDKIRQCVEYLIEKDVGVEVVADGADKSADSKCVK